MWLFIQPVDTVFFRDGRPFDAGADVWTGTIFPPYPPSVYGMIRTLITHLISPRINYKDFFSSVPEEFRNLLGNTKKLGDLSIRGPFLGVKEDTEVSLWMPSPADLCKHEDDNNRLTYFLLQPDSCEKIYDCSNLNSDLHPLRFFPGIDGSKLDPADGVIGRSDLNRYLKGELKGGQLLKIKERAFWQSEAGTIIKREETLSVEEHQLAFPMHTRMQDQLRFEQKGLLVHLDPIEQNLASRISTLFTSVNPANLGGECRVSLVESVSVKDLPGNAIKERISQSGKFRVVLTSPGYFPINGFYPDFLSQKNEGVLEGEWKIGNLARTVRLISMIMSGRPTRMGGWDLAAARPKPMVKTVPAGSVFFFEINEFKGKEDQSWIDSLFNGSLPGILPDEVTDYTKQGLNTILIGGWDYVPSQRNSCLSR